MSVSVFYVLYKSFTYLLISFFLLLLKVGVFGLGIIGLGLKFCGLSIDRTVYGLIQITANSTFRCTSRGMVDPVERLGHGMRGCRRLLPSVERHHLRHERRGRASVHATSCADDTAQRARHEEPLGDLV